MGRAIASAFIASGDAVVLSDRSREALDEAARTVEGIASTIGCDVSTAEACARMAAEVVDRHGGIDVLVTAAGVWVEGASEAMTEPQWDRTIDVNLKGTFFSIAAAIPSLVERRGCVVAISSDYGQSWSLLSGFNGCYDFASISFTGPR